ncbi:PhzF family phenazine biosynthesis protein [Pseudomonas gingeri]|uniref:PhzF family phenazine biosynthesis protein n=1 Tax=Pseudomonas gingeri TaxID=117681 RepID=UPI0015A034A7|nr:PhzF family phenazine biosynthesis protein [Pseudomonas gingeri]NWA28246.1 PhzF family phenazine biosynthesis protein [Pseudomonas gingeri]
MSQHDFKQLDVFSREPFKGNPLAVVFAADSLTDEQMQAFSTWTNLSETTFLQTPQDPRADYRVRIFTTSRELPFAGHPTLGSCHAWLEAGGVPQGEEIIQECGIGLVRIRRRGDDLAFIAPPFRREGPLDEALRERVRLGLGLAAEEVLDAQWVDNGVDWLVLMLPDRARVLALKPDQAQLKGLAVGVVAPWDPLLDGDDCQFEVRAFISGDGVPEDPATGSLNAGIARWLLGEGRAPQSYRASQGTAMGRAGRIQVEQVGDEIWVGGAAVTCITGSLNL